MARPSSNSGQRRWLWMLASAIGEPQMIAVLSSSDASPSIVSRSRSRKYGSWPDAVPADRVEVQDPLLVVPVVRGGVERTAGAALREDAVLRVAAGLERDDARHVGLQRQHLEIEQKLHVLGERVGHAARRVGQLARLARRRCAPRPSGCGARPRGRRRGSDPGAGGRRRPAPCGPPPRRSGSSRGCCAGSPASRPAPRACRPPRTASRTRPADRGSSAAARSATTSLWSRCRRTSSCRCSRRPGPGSRCRAAATASESTGRSAARRAGRATCRRTGRSPASASGGPGSGRPRTSGSGRRRSRAG